MQRPGCLFRLAMMFGAGILMFAISTVVFMVWAPNTLTEMFLALGGIGLVVIAGIAVIAFKVIARAKLAANHEELLRLARICPVCGYNLRTTPDFCPECGTPTRQPSSNN